MKKTKENQVSAEALDVKTISQKLESLPHDRLMYVAGAITALAAITSLPTSACQMKT